jgi:hypothetical protein
MQLLHRVSPHDMTESDSRPQRRQLAAGDLIRTWPLRHAGTPRQIANAGAAAEGLRDVAEGVAEGLLEVEADDAEADDAEDECLRRGAFFAASPSTRTAALASHSSPSVFEKSNGAWSQYIEPVEMRSTKIGSSVPVIHRGVAT